MSDINHLASELARLGTRCVFGIPGEGPSLELLTELEHLGCAFHLVPHEAAGALMAGGFGRVSGVPGVSLSIKGPGFSNMLSGIASNWLDRNPALSLSESYGAGSSPYRTHKRLAHGTMARPVVKAYADNLTPDFLPELWRLSMAEEPGPIHFDISQRMDQRSFECLAPVREQSGVLSVEVARRIQAAQRPVVIAGALATRRPWRDKLAKLKIPVFTTVAGKGAIDETLAHAAGVFTNSGGPLASESAILPLADLIVGLGLRTTEIIEVKPLPAPLINLDELADRTQGLEAVLEDCVATEGFTEALALVDSKAWGVAETAAAKALLEKRLAPERWLPAGSLRIVQRVLPEATRFFLDTGNFCTIGEHVLSARHPLHVMGSALARSMGIALPVGIGAALAAPDIPVVIVAGDGGIRMYPESISVAVRERLPLLVLLMTDGFFSTIQRDGVKKGLSPNTLRLSSSGWPALFQSLGCPAMRIESLAGLSQALRAWDRNTGPLFLELAYDADDYAAMTDGIR